MDTGQLNSYCEKEIKINRESLGSMFLAIHQIYFVIFYRDKITTLSESTTGRDENVSLKYQVLECL
jgi:hypothetical protein